MNIDFKISTWERAEIPEEFEEQILKATKEGKITSINDLDDLLDEIDKNKTDFIKWEVLPEVEEYLNIEDNGGQATIEITDDALGRNTIWDNT